METQETEKYVCKVCGYIYQGPVGSFAALPDCWKCPKCGVDKSYFEKID